MSDNHNRRGEAENSQQVQKLCLFCRQNITNLLYAKCTEPTCKDVEMCFNCFSVGMAIPPHHPTHAYKIIDATSIPLYSDDWGADEELALLRAIEKCGLGNWTDISAYVGGNKKDHNCEEHYFNYYLFSPTSPLPDPKQPYPALTRICLEQNTPAGLELSSLQFHEEKTLLEYISAGGTIVDLPNVTLPQHIIQLLQNSRTNHNKNKKKSLQAHHSSYERWLRCRLKQAHFEKPYEASRWKLQQMEFRTQQRNSLHVSSGYLQQRNDFETEYMNDAEKDISEMEFHNSDTTIERELKLRVLEMYNQILDERSERKEFIDRYQLLVKREKRLSREELQVYKTLRPFARYLEPDEFDELVRSVVIERALRLRIEQLQTYRLNGVQTLADGAALDNEFGRVTRQWETTYRKKFLNLSAVPIGQHQALQTILTSLDKELELGNDSNNSGEGAGAGGGTVAQGLGFEEESPSDASTPSEQQQQQQQTRSRQHPPPFSAFSANSTTKTTTTTPGSSFRGAWAHHTLPVATVPALFSANSKQTTATTPTAVSSISPTNSNNSTMNNTTMTDLPANAQQASISSAVVQQANNTTEASTTAASGGSNSTTATTSTTAGPGSSEAVFDLSQYPHAAVLSHAEQLLCRELHLLPQHYLVIKDRLIKESVQQGYITKGTARNVLKVDVHCTDKVVNFCISKNIIPNVVLPDHDLPSSKTTHATSHLTPLQSHQK